MAQLKQIVSSILRDMVYAQHQANMYAITLSEAYKKEGREANFPLPGVALGELEVEIAYGISEVSQQPEQQEVNIPKLRQHSREIADKLAKVILSSALVVAKECDDMDDANKHIIEQLEKDANTNTRFCSFLSRKLFKKMQSDYTNLVKHDGAINELQLTSIAKDVAEQHVINQNELTSLFAKVKDGRPLGELFLDSLQSDLAANLPSVPANVNLINQHNVPSVDVVVSSKELADLPEDCLNTIKLKIHPRETDMSLMDND